MKRQWILGTVGIAVLAVAMVIAGGRGAWAHVSAALASEAIRAPAATRVVTSTADSGPGTLRQALLDAVNGDTITFDPAVFPPGSPVTIALTSGLPEITQGNLTIDASNAGVVIDGSGTPDDTNGLVITSSDNTIKGLQTLRFPENGIVIKNGAQNNVIGGNRAVGSGPTGEGNVLSGHGDDNGIEIRDSATVNNTIIGNLIGTDATGTQAVPNAGPGIFIWLGANRNWIKGNVISGNSGDGIGISGSNTVYNTISGNYIGTKIYGASVLGNNWNGVDISDGASNNTIGGATLGERNLISGNDHNGISISGSGTTSNTVIGNHIGTDVSGTSVLGNAVAGVESRKVIPPYCLEKSYRPTRAPAVNYRFILPFGQILWTNCAYSWQSWHK
jgi:hypothetical protein